VDDLMLVTVGVDTHTDVHVAAVLDPAGRLLAGCQPSSVRRRCGSSSGPRVRSSPETGRSRPSLETTKSRLSWGRLVLDPLGSLTRALPLRSSRQTTKIEPTSPRCIDVTPRVLQPAAAGASDRP
jgi:hypothetical protein